MEAFFKKALLDAGITQKIVDIRALGGGCINNATKVSTSEQVFFLKWNPSMPVDFFLKEKKGLEILAGNSTFYIPKTIFCSEVDGIAFIILEYFNQGKASQNFWSLFGEKLAFMHRASFNYFGLDHDNYIGKLTQSNTYTDGWLDFFLQQRLKPQFELAEQNKLIGTDWKKWIDKLRSSLNDFFPDEPPSLLHGDLWSGNFMKDGNGEATIIDPAVYFGHREIELAFTEMFGGFAEEFYKSYQSIFPLEPEFKDRVEVYNLYPNLVHLNLFGPSYLPPIVSTIKKFI